MPKIGCAIEVPVKDNDEEAKKGEGMIVSLLFFLTVLFGFLKSLFRP